jgi:hypothetical protein
MYKSLSATQGEIVAPMAATDGYVGVIHALDEARVLNGPGRVSFLFETYGTLTSVEFKLEVFALNAGAMSFCINVDGSLAENIDPAAAAGAAVATCALADGTTDTVFSIPDTSIGNWVWANFDVDDLAPGWHVLNIKNRESNARLRTVRAKNEDDEGNNDACFRALPMRFPVVGALHDGGTFGQYFNFNVADAESALGGTIVSNPDENPPYGIWTVERFSNYIPQWIGEVRVKPECGDCLLGTDAHGSYESGAAEGQWVGGDEIAFIFPSGGCAIAGGLDGVGIQSADGPGVICGGWYDWCTRWILCTDEADCLSRRDKDGNLAAITSAQDCADAAGKTLECAKEYIEWRNTSDCQCNPAGMGLLRYNNDESTIYEIACDVNKCEIGEATLGKGIKGGQPNKGTCGVPYPSCGRWIICTTGDCVLMGIFTRQQCAEAVGNAQECAHDPGYIEWADQVCVCLPWWYPWTPYYRNERTTYQISCPTPHPTSSPTPSPTMPTPYPTPSPTPPTPSPTPSPTPPTPAPTSAPSPAPTPMPTTFKGCMKKYFQAMVTSGRAPKEVTQEMVKRAMKKKGTGGHGREMKGTHAEFLEATGQRTKGFHNEGKFTQKQVSEALAAVCASERTRADRADKEVAEKVWKDIKKQKNGLVPPSEHRQFGYYIQHSQGRYCDNPATSESSLGSEFSCRDVCSAALLCRFYTYSPREKKCTTYTECPIERGGNHPFAVTMYKIPVPEDLSQEPYYDLFAHSYAHRSNYPQGPGL